MIERFEIREHDRSTPLGRFGSLSNEFASALAQVLQGYCAAAKKF